MTEAEKTKIREAIKNDVKLSQAYKQLIKMKQRGKLRKEINPDEVMVSLVAKYGLNAAGLVDAQDNLEEEQKIVNKDGMFYVRRCSLIPSERCHG